MGKNPESKLIQTLNAHPDNDLSMIGKPVLVQNQLGIFFGFLQKADTRKGTALLSNGYEINRGRHITFVQYLRVMTSESVRHDYRGGFQSIARPRFREYIRTNTITDYANEGIAPYFNLLEDYSVGTSLVPVSTSKSYSKLISLTEIKTIVPIDTDQEIHYGSVLIDHQNKETSALTGEQPASTISILTSKGLKAGFAGINALQDNLPISNDNGLEVLNLVSNNKSSAAEVVFSTIGTFHYDWNLDLLKKLYVS